MESPCSNIFWETDIFYPDSRLKEVSEGVVQLHGSPIQLSKERCSIITLRSTRVFLYFAKLDQIRLESSMSNGQPY